jgi:hypothetical protein
MYAAVQSPMPGSVSSLAMVCSTGLVVRSNVGSLITAAASEEMAAARAPGMPMLDRSACASAFGSGNRTLRSLAEGGPMRRWPNVAASRPASVDAADTLTCWPSIALTASSNASHAPGTRNPERAARRRASAGSRLSCAAIGSGSASRSKRWRNRAATAANAGSRSTVIAASRKASALALTSTIPCVPSRLIVRR